MDLRVDQNQTEEGKTMNPKKGRPLKGAEKMQSKTVCLPPRLWAEIKQAGAGEYSRGLRMMLGGKT